MSATRSRKEERSYKKYLLTKDKSKCVFCEFTKKDSQVIYTTRSFKIVRNIFAYSIWDGQRVADHLMIVPKHHTETVSDFSNEQAVELLALISRYEQKGYNFYSRAPQSKIKSIPHQHSHLIKTNGPAKRLIILLRKPYFRIVF